MTSESIPIVKKFEQSQDSLVLQSSDLSLATISQMVGTGAIDVEPHYQRRERWKPSAQRELIESFLLNVPVPPVYLSEDDFGTYSVIDGKQRITAISAFLGNQFSLDELKKFPEINGFFFSDLPPQLQNALLIRPYIRVVTLLKQTDPELKYEVFTRLNTGGQPLSPQEIRNALYRGKLNDALFSLSRDDFLRLQLKIATEKESAYTEMTDVEMVLRFFTLKDSWENFSGDYRRAMDNFMATNKKIRPADLEKISKNYLRALSRCQKLWGETAFKRHTGTGYRDQFLASIYDAQMISVADLSVGRFNEILGKKAKLQTEMKKLFSNEDFEEAIRVSTNTPSKVKHRVSTVTKLLGAI